MADAEEIETCRQNLHSMLLTLLASLGNNTKSTLKSTVGEVLDKLREPFVGVNGSWSVTVPHAINNEEVTSGFV